MTIYTQSGEFDKEIKSIKELIAFFDNLAEKPLFLNFIGQNVKFWGKDNEEEAAKDEYKYEDLAFSLVENINIEAWNTRFGPINYIKHGDEVIIEKPEFKEITADAISYWEQRINEVTNPVIKLQYLGLVHTFKEKITGKKCSDTFLRDYVETIINASENNFELDLTSAQIHLPFAFEISKAYPDLLTKVKNEYFRLSKAAQLHHIGVWMPYFNLMKDNHRDKSVFSTKENQVIVSFVESRLSDLMALDPTADGDNKLNPFNVKEVAMALAQYYKQTNSSTDKERVITYIDRAFRAILSQGNPMQQMLWLEEIQKCYSGFGMNTQAQAIYPDIQACREGVISSLEKHRTSISIPQDTIKKLIDEINFGSEDEIYQKFVQKLTPKHSAAVAFVQKQKLNPLAGMMGKIVLSSDGLPLSTIGTPAHDSKGNEFDFCARFIEGEEPAMRQIVLALIKAGVFTLEKIMGHIMNSGLIDESRRCLIQRGIEFYLIGEGMVACHLLVPQIEHAIHNLALKLGVQAMRMQPSGNGYMIQLMDKLFDLREIQDTLGDDSVFYLRTLLTEQRGLNLRNQLCHAMIDPLYFDINKADRIVHALLLLGGVNCKF